MTHFTLSFFFCSSIIILIKLDKIYIFWTLSIINNNKKKKTNHKTKKNERICSFNNGKSPKLTLEYWEGNLIYSTNSWSLFLLDEKEALPNSSYFPGIYLSMIIKTWAESPLLRSFQLQLNNESVANSGDGTLFQSTLQWILCVCVCICRLFWLWCVSNPFCFRFICFRWKNQIKHNLYVWLVLLEIFLGFFFWCCC